MTVREEDDIVAQPIVHDSRLVYNIFGQTPLAIRVLGCHNVSSNPN